MLAIKNNLIEVDAGKHLGPSYDGLFRFVERLSSALHINSTKDDAADLAARELIRSALLLHARISVMLKMGY